MAWRDTRNDALHAQRAVHRGQRGHGEWIRVGVVAETVRDLASRGVPQSEALAQGEWPWDPKLLESAVRLGREVEAEPLDRVILAGDLNSTVDDRGLAPVVPRLEL